MGLGICFKFCQDFDEILMALDKLVPTNLQQSSLTNLLYSSELAKSIVANLLLLFLLWKLIESQSQISKIFYMCHPQPLFLHFRRFYAVDRNKVLYKKLAMTGFELQTSGIGSNCSANWATTTVQLSKMFTRGAVIYRQKMFYSIAFWMPNRDGFQRMSGCQFLHKI